MPATLCRVWAQRPYRRYALFLLCKGLPGASRNALSNVFNMFCMQGQVVTATLSPGNLAMLSHIQYTGSTSLDLQGDTLFAMTQKWSLFEALAD